MVDNITVPCVHELHTSVHVWRAWTGVYDVFHRAHDTSAVHVYKSWFCKKKTVWCRWAHKRFRHLLHIVGVYPIEYGVVIIFLFARTRPVVSASEWLNLTSHFMTWKVHWHCSQEPFLSVNQFRDQKVSSIQTDCLFRCVQMETVRSWIE